MLATHGLRGTSLSKVKTESELEQVMMKFPSIKRRRPVNHSLDAAAWQRAAKRVFG